MRLSVISCLLFLQGMAGYAQKRTIDKVVCVVGNDIILLSEIQGQMLELVQNKVEIKEETECVLTENFLYNALLLHQAKVDSIEVNQEAIQAELDSKLQYYKQLLDQYGQTFQTAYGKSELEWREEIQEVLERRSLIEQMQAKITQNVNITPREVKQFFKKIPIDSLPRINSRVEYGQIVVTPSVSKEAEQKVLNDLNKWRQQVLDGETEFSTIATLYSQDPGSADKGGNFECVSKGQFVPEFDAMALSLEEGQISQPFKTSYGWHIIKLDKRRGKTYCGSHILRIPRMRQSDLDNSKSFIDGITDSLKSGRLDFCKATIKYSDDEQSKFSCGKVMNPRDGSIAWDVSELDRQIGITLDQLEEGEISEPFIFNKSDRQQAYRIYKLEKRSKPHVANLNEDYELLSNAALNEKRQKLIDVWVNSKVKQTHVWISPEYQKCDYKYDWIKTTAEVK